MLEGVQNLLLYNRRFKERRFPHRINIEITNICTARCVFCPSVYSKRHRGKMSMKLFKKIIDEALTYDELKRIAFHVAGEPLVHPRLEEMIKMCKDRRGDIVTHLSTNASLLTRDKAVALLEAGIDYVSISISGGNKELYEKMVGLKWEGVDENIIDFLRVLSERKTKPEVEIIIITTPGMKNEWITKVENTINVLSLGNDVKVRRKPLESMGGQIDAENVAVKGKVSSTKLDLLRAWLKGNMSCRQIYDWLNIHHDGNVPGCCYDMDGNLSLGNVEQESLYEIWHGKKISSLREAFRKTNFRTLPEMCQQCVINRQRILY